MGVAVVFLVALVVLQFVRIVELTMERNGLRASLSEKSKEARYLRTKHGDMGWWSQDKTHSGEK